MRKIQLIDRYENPRGKDFRDDDGLRYITRPGYLGRILAVGLVGAIGVGAAMSLAKNGNPEYNGKWGEPHIPERSTLFDEIRYHNLPGDWRYWREIIEKNPDNKNGLKGKIRMPEPNKSGH